jgi:hypothetical protein
MQPVDAPGHGDGTPTYHGWKQKKYNKFYEVVKWIVLEQFNTRPKAFNLCFYTQNVSYIYLCCNCKFCVTQ